MLEEQEKQKKKNKNLNDGYGKLDEDHILYDELMIYDLMDGWMDVI